MSFRTRSRGASILAALVFAAILGSVMVAIQTVSPTNLASQGAQAGSVWGSGAAPVPYPTGTLSPQSGAGTTNSTAQSYLQTQSASKDATGDAKLSGPVRCTQPIKDKKEQKEGADAVQNVCVPGCEYEVMQVKVNTEVRAKDMCASLTAGQGREQCEKTRQCIVKHCIDGKCETLSGAAANSAIGKGARVPEFFKNEKPVLDALALTKQNPAQAEKMVSGMDPWLQDAYNQAKTDEQLRIESQIQEKSQAYQKNLNELDRLGSVGADDRLIKNLQDKNAQIERDLGKLTEENANLAKVDVDKLRQNSVWLGSNGQGAVDCTKNPSACLNGQPITTTQKPAITGAVPLPQQRPSNLPNNNNTFNGPGGPGSGQSGSGSSGGLMSGLGDFFKGVLKGFSGAGGLGSQQPQAGACPTDPQAYARYQQEYQQHLQQYNYQLQQYNYQRQLAEYYGSTPPAPLNTAPPVPCNPSLTNPNNPNGTQCQNQPQRPTSGCNGTWEPILNGSCVANWRCVPSGSTDAPQADLSCQPQIADAGMSVAITYACTNATKSAGTGFATNNQLSGSATVTLNPPANANVATYTLSCGNDRGQSAKDQCKVQIARPKIVLTAEPKKAPLNTVATIAWVTSGMDSCVIASPDQPDFTERNASRTTISGAATTSPIKKDTRFTLTCTTLGGNTKTASTTVTLAESTAISVTSTIDGKDAVKRGATTTISWSAQTTAANAAISLWLFDNRLGQSTGLIARDLSLTGTTTWKLPLASDPCPADSPYVCASDLVDGRTYSIEAAIYRPKEAYLGGYPPQNAVQPEFIDFGFGEDFTIDE